MESTITINLQVVSDIDLVEGYYIGSTKNHPGMHTSIFYYKEGLWYYGTDGTLDYPIDIEYHPSHVFYCMKK